MLRRIGNPDVAKALTNIVWLGLERLTQIVVAIAISGLLARYFGPDAFGKWQYANTLLLVLSPITWVCGAEILVPTIVDRASTGLGSVLGSAFVLRMAVSALALAATWGWIALGHLDPLVGAMLAGLAVTMLFREPLVGVINAWLQSMTYSKPQFAPAWSPRSSRPLLVYALVRAGAGSRASAGCGRWNRRRSAACWCCTTCAVMAARSAGTSTRRLFRRFASAGTVFWVGLICMYLFLKLDRLMLERYISFADLGRYSAAQQLNENWITLALMLAQTIAPAFVYRVQDAALLRRNIVRLVAMTAALMIGGAIVLDLLAGFIITRVFGPDYAGAIEIFRWAVWLSVPAGIEAIGNLVVLKYQAKFVLLAKWLLALAVAFVVDWIAIPRLGGHGALVGLAAGYLAAASVNLYYIRFRLRA